MEEGPRAGGLLGSRSGKHQRLRFDMHVRGQTTIVRGHATLANAFAFPFGTDASDNSLSANYDGPPWGCCMVLRCTGGGCARTRYVPIMFFGGGNEHWISEFPKNSQTHELQHCSLGHSLLAHIREDLVRLTCPPRSDAQLAAATAASDAAATAPSDARDDEAAPLLVPHVAQRFEGIDWTWKYLAAFWTLLDDKRWLDRDPARFPERWRKTVLSVVEACDGAHVAQLLHLIGWAGLQCHSELLDALRRLAGISMAWRTARLAASSFVGFVRCFENIRGWFIGWFFQPKAPGTVFPRCLRS